MRKRFIFVAIVMVIFIAGVHTVAGHETTPRHPEVSEQVSVSNDAALQNIVNTWAMQAPQNAANPTVVVRELTGDKRGATYRDTTSIVPASTYKLYVAYAVLHAIEQGKYKLSAVTSDGNSIQTDLNNMILNSDNNAARTLGFLVGWQAMDTLLKTQGIDNTNLNNYVGASTTPTGDKHTTAADLQQILNKLYAGKLLSASNTQLLLGLMKQQNYRQRIPAGVPKGIVVADKPGWLSYADGDGETAQNDAAIIYGPRSTYILVITTTGSTTQPLTNLSKLIYAYLET